MIPSHHMRGLAPPQLSLMGVPCTPQVGADLSELGPGLLLLHPPVRHEVVKDFTWGEQPLPQWARQAITGAREQLQRRDGGAEPCGP